MATQKTLIRGGWIIAYNGREHALLKDGVIVVEGNSVTHVGKTYDGVADTVIDASPYLISPGLISLHAHMMNSPLNKSFFEDTGSRQFGMSGLYDFGAVDNAATQADFRLCAEFSAAEMLKTGTTTVVELNRQNAETALDVIGNMGLRAYIVPAYRSGGWYTPDGKKVHYRWNEDAGFAGLRYSIEFIEKHRGAFDGRIDSMLSPYQVDTCTEELFKASKEAAEKLGVRLHTHAAQSLVEFNAIMERHGLTPVQWLDRVGVLDSNLIIGHGIFISGHSAVNYPGDHDLNLLAASGATVAHCPWVFARRSIALESFSRYLKAGVNLAIGTDTFPQDIIHDMKIASTVSKLIDRDCCTATAREVFDAATLGGAKALGRDDLGRIAPGAKADLLFFKRHTLRMSPLRDPLKNIVFNSASEDIDRVMVDGRFVVEAGRVTGIDEEKLAASFQTAMERMWAAAPQHDRAGRTIDELAPPSLPDWEE